MQLLSPRLARASLSSLAFAAFVMIAPAARADVIDVVQSGLTFSPKDIVINEGDTVTWHWSNGTHTVTEGTDGVINGNEAFTSDLTAAVPTFSVTFDAAFLAANPRVNDRYDYFCAIHFALNMVGSVTVCSPAPSTYCTSRPSSIPGCTPAIGFDGAPSLGQGGFMVNAGPTPGAKLGIFVYTNTGAAATPLQNAYGFLCINPSGLTRFGTQSTGGTSGACNGQLAIDFTAYALTKPGLTAGTSVDLQAWYRDPGNPGGANLTDALHFVLCP